MADSARDAAIRDFVDHKISKEQLKEVLAPTSTDAGERPSFDVDDLDGVERAMSLIRRIRW